MQSTFEHQAFTLVKFDPDNILLHHNATRQLYRYSEASPNTLEEPTHHLILKAYRLCAGFIYEKELTTLAKQIQPKIQAPTKAYFSQTELANTFEPILLYLQRGLYYNGLSLETILVDGSGNIRLKDPRLNRVSENNITQFQRLGLIMLQCALLKNPHEAAQIEKSKANLVKILGSYSLKFIANLWVLLNNVESLLNEIKLSEQPIQCETFKKEVEQFEKIKLSSTSSQEKKDIFRSVQQKRIVVIPPLNLKFEKVKKAEIKMDLASKTHYHHNQNQNEESLPKTVKKAEIVKKVMNFKCQTNKNIEQKLKLKAKKSQRVENFESPLKKKGKTVDKKGKFQQRSN